MTQQPEGDRRHLRVGDHERDAVTEALRDAFAQGRITREELDERLDATMAARTEADLRAVTADLPQGNQPGAYGPPPIHDLPRAAGPPRLHAPWAHAPGGHGDMGTWGYHLNAAQRHAQHAQLRAQHAQRHALRHAHWHASRRGRHHGPPKIVFILAILAVVALASGTVWPLFAALKIFFIIWLAVTLIGFFRRHRSP